MATTASANSDRPQAINRVGFVRELDMFVQTLNPI